MRLDPFYTVCNVHCAFDSVCSNYYIWNVSVLKTKLYTVFLFHSLIKLAMFVFIFIHIFAFCCTFCSCYQLSFLPLLSGETKKCLGASVLWGPGAAAAAAEGEDECWWAAGEDEEAPEGPRPPAQTHPESRRPPRRYIVAHLVLILTATFSRLGISMLLEQYHTSHSHAWWQPKRVAIYSGMPLFSVVISLFLTLQSWW